MRRCSYIISADFADPQENELIGVLHFQSGQVRENQEYSIAVDVYLKLK